MIKVALKSHSILITDSLVELPKIEIEVKNELIFEYAFTGIAFINGFATIVIIKK